MTSYGLDEWFWAMFEPTWTWPNFTFDQLFMRIEANSDTSSVGPSNKDHPFARWKCSYNADGLKDLCILQWQIAWDISVVSKEPNLLFGWLITHGTLYTAHSITCTVLCWHLHNSHKMLLLWKGWVCLCIMSENNWCSLIKFHAPLCCQGHCC